MYKILHADEDFLLCSFEFEDLETGEHIFASFFDDPLWDLLSKYKKEYPFELEGLVIPEISEDLHISTKEEAAIISNHHIDGVWLFPWLRKKEETTKKKK